MTLLKNLRVLSALAFLFLILSACRKELRQSDQLNLQSPQSQTTAQLQREVANALSLKTPNPLLEGYKTAEVYPELINQSLDQVTATPCNSSTLLRSWLTQQVADWTPAQRADAAGLAMTSIPGDYAYLFENSSAN